MKKIVFAAVFLGMLLLGNLTVYADCRWDAEGSGLVAVWDELDSKGKLYLYKGTSYKVGDRISVSKSTTSYNFTQRIKEAGPGTYHFTITDTSGRTWESENYQVGEDMIEDFRSLSWIQENGQWKLKDYNGRYLTGWQLVGDKWYYLDTATGVCLMNTYTPDGYYVGPTGEWDPSVPKQ